MVASPKAIRHWLYSKSKGGFRACSKTFAILVEGVQLEDRVPSRDEVRPHLMETEELATIVTVAAAVGDDDGKK